MGEWAELGYESCSRRRREYQRIFEHFMGIEASQWQADELVHDEEGSTVNKNEESIQYLIDKGKPKPARFGRQIYTSKALRSFP